MASLLERTYNPDVLTCLANLSNDEVLTPPELANQVLDLLPDDLWRDPSVKILDPFCKSGVFLREAAKRFIRGLEDVYPDLQERVDHVMHEQLYGIAITEMTALLSRRSLYCSKFPNGRFSVSEFDGNEEHPLPQHPAHVAEREVRLLRRLEGAVRPRRGPRVARLRVHPHQQPRGDLWHEVRRDRRQSAVPTERWGE